MLLPKRVKYRRVQRGRMTGKAMRGNKVNQGDYGLVALEPAWITSNQIEAARVAMTRYIKRGGKVWIKIFPDKPVTAKTAFLIIDNLRFPSSVHQLFCGRRQTAILIIAEIHNIAFTAAGILKSGKVSFQTYIKII